MESAYTQDTLIAAPATPLAPAALAVIRLSGPDCLKMLAPLFSRPKALAEAPGHTLHYGTLLDPAASTPLDEVLISAFRAPRSYTGEESAEISCHGSPVVVQSVMELLERHGFRRAAPGEFTYRAWLNGKLDLTRAEAVHELVSARTDTARRLALTRLSGALEQRLDEIRDDLTLTASSLALALDYPEDEAEAPDPAEWPLDRLEERVDTLLSTWRIGRLYQEGAVVVLAGSTNAGKSSLFNLIIREERSIVSDVHGTTRDYLETEISLDGIPVRLIDTAGLRVSADSVEQEGIRRSERMIGSADLLLYLVDAVTGLTEEDRARLKSAQERGAVLAVWNKTDHSGAGLVPENFLPVSAVTGDGFEALHRQIKKVLTGGAVSAPDGMVIESERQKKGLEDIREALAHIRQGLLEGQPLDLISVDLETALEAVGRITGEITPDEILETMFARFCVGK